MGTFYVTCEVENHTRRTRRAKVPKLLVDTGSEFTWIPAGTLEKIGVKPEKKDVAFQMANGQWPNGHTRHWFRSPTGQR